MAETNHTESTTSEDRANNTGRSLDPFKWNPESLEHFPHTRMLNRIANLSPGVVVALEIIEADNMNEGDFDCFGSVLNPYQKGALLRLAIEASQIIADECVQAFDWAEENGMNCIKHLVEREAAKG